MRAKPARTRRTKRVSANHTLKINLLLLVLSLTLMAGTAKLFYMVTAQRMYQPIEWRINKLAMKTPDAVKTPPISQEKKNGQGKTKVTAAGTEYLFWDILRDQKPVDTP